MALLIATASIVLVFTNRPSLRDYWKSVLQISRRIGIHYRYIFRILFHKYKEWDLKRSKKSQEQKVRESARFTAIQVIYYEEYDPFAIFALVYTSVNLAFCLAILINFVYLVIVYKVVYYEPTAKNVPSLPEKVIEYIPTDADKQEINFRPFLESYEAPLGDASFKNVALIDNIGQIKFSQKYMAQFDQKLFSKTNDHRIKNSRLMSSGVIMFTGVDKIKFNINPYQAFQILNDPYMTFMFNEGGELFGAISNNVEFILISN